MGLRSSKLKAAAKPNKPWGCITLALLPLLALGAFITWLQLSGHGPGSPASKHRIQQQRARHDAVADALNKNGATYHYNGSVGVLTLPHAEAMSITPTMAKELALSIYQRTGSPSRVESPAGQILGEAP